MAKVKVLHKFHETDYSIVHEEGDVIEISDERAESLIQRGLVENPEKDEKTEKTEKTKKGKAKSEKAPEKAAEDEDKNPEEKKPEDKE